ncbi:hypothetical protein [Alistipes indistinctus]
MYKFNAPQERVGPEFFTSEQDFSNVNTGRFVRNLVLNGKTYGESDIVPAYLKTADLVPCQLVSQYSTVESQGNTCYGRVLSSAGVAYGILSPEGYGSWAPGGNGVDSWVAVKLPEASLCESYLVRTTAAVAPLSWKLQGSLDGEAWADLHVVDSTGQWAAAGENKTFTVPEESRGAYLWYRLYVTASNATTMTLQNLRLFRPASVCPAGSMYLDASASSPLVLSFANGFASDGSTPVDEVLSVSTSEIIELGTIKNKWTAAGLVDNLNIVNSGELTPINIYAVKNSAGAFDIEYELSAALGNTYFGKERIGNVDQFGFTSTGEQANGWGGQGGSNQLASASILTRTDNQPFFVSAIKARYTYNPFTINIQFTNIDDSIQTVKADLSQGEVTIWVNRYVKSINSTNTISNNWTKYLATIKVYGYASTITRKYQSGKVWETTDGIDWTPVRKIYLGSVTVKNDAICAVHLNSPLVMSTGFANQIVGI